MKKIDIELIRKLCDSNKIKWTVHCLERIQERDITIDDVKNCILNGEIIENYPDDFPYPSALIFGLRKNKTVIHVVCGSDQIFLYIITAYIPNLLKFEQDMKTRRIK